MGIETCLEGGRLSPCECAIDEAPADGSLAAPPDANRTSDGGPDAETGQPVDGGFFDATTDASHAGDTGADAGDGD
jgi:hypothetical protein